MLAKELISIEENRTAKLILKEVVSMLVGLIKSNSNRMYEPDKEYKTD